MLSYQEKSTESTSKLSDLGILDQLIQLDTDKIVQELDSLTVAIDPSGTHNPSSSWSVSEIEGDTPQTPGDDIKESSIIPFKLELKSKLDWFESLNGIQKIAVSLILG